MFAIVKIGHQQFKVRKDEEIFVHRLEGKAGDQVEIGQVLLVSEDGKINLEPGPKKTLKAEILDQVKGDKVTAFKMKRRKGFRKKKGFRQSFSRIKIQEFV